MTDRKIRFGVNYVPSRRWHYCWNDWDAGSVARDLDAIAALGADHLRVQLIWPWFQPNPATVSAAHLQRLRELLTLARERRLDVLPGVLTGWLSGYRFLPPDVAPADVFVKDSVIAMEKILFHAVLDVALEFPNFLGFDMGNEINCLAQELPPAAGDRWSRDLTAWLRPQMQGRWLVNGTDHTPWFCGRTFTLPRLVADYDAVCVHAWPKFTSCLMRGELDDAPATRVAEFLTRVSRHFLARAGADKPVWIQEFGCSKLWGAERQREKYMRQTIANAAGAGATWFTWWCSHDIDPAYRFDPLEYDLGLLSVSNGEKPLGKIYREIIRQLSKNPPAVADLDFAIPPDFAPAMNRVLPLEQWLEQNLQTTTWDLYDRYLSQKKNL